MKRIRHDMRLTLEEKKLLEKHAEAQGVTMTEYVKYKLFDQNPDCTTSEYIYHCPSGERYNYAMAGLVMTNYILLENLIQHFFKDNGPNIIKESLFQAQDILEEDYHYTKTKMEQDE